MDTYVEAGPENQSRLFTELNSQNKSKGGAFVGFTDKRLSAIAQRHQIDLMNAPAFPEEAGSIAPMGASAIRGNVLQQYSDKGSSLNGGMCVQMKAFKNFPAGNALGLQDDQVAFFGEGYNHYQKDVEGLADKGVAFKAIAKLGGQVGAVADQLLHKQVLIGNYKYYKDNQAQIPFCYCWNPPGKIWKKHENGIDQKITQVLTAGIENNITINPFVITAKAKYLNAGLEKNLMTTSMYDHAHYSYVVKVEDEGNGNKGIMEGFFNKKNPNHNGYVPYPGQHIKNGNQKILNATNQEIEPYTKLAGEGARFMCVRDHIHNIQDNTIFYTRVNIKGYRRFRGITFHNLWGSWDNIFEKKFNIDDRVIVKAIKKQNPKKNGNINAQRDYYLNYKEPKWFHAGKAIDLI